MADYTGPLDNPQREVFAQLVASGMRAAEAYREAYRTADDKVITGARQHGSRLMTYDDVKGRIRQLQAKSGAGIVLTLSQKREFLHKLVTTAIGDIDESSPLCQSYEYSENGRKYRMPDKLGALKLDAQLAGELSEQSSAAPTITLNVGFLLDCQAPAGPEGKIRDVIAKVSRSEAAGE